MDGVYTSLASNTITFQTGTYKITARGTCYNAGRTQLRLQDTTNSITLLTGLSITTSTSAQSMAYLSGVFNITGTTNVQLQQNSQSTRVNIGMGIAVTTVFSTASSVYALVDIYKMA